MTKDELKSLLVDGKILDGVATAALVDAIYTYSESNPLTKDIKKNGKNLEFTKKDGTKVSLPIGDNFDSKSTDAKIKQPKDSVDKTKINHATQKSTQQTTNDANDVKIKELTQTPSDFDWNWYRYQYDSGYNSGLHPETKILERENKYLKVNSDGSVTIIISQSTNEYDYFNIKVNVVMGVVSVSYSTGTQTISGSVNARCTIYAQTDTEFDDVNHQPGIEITLAQTDYKSVDVTSNQSDSSILTFRPTKTSRDGLGGVIMIGGSAVGLQHLIHFDTIDDKVIYQDNIFYKDYNNDGSYTYY